MSDWLCFMRYHLLIVHHSVSTVILLLYGWEHHILCQCIQSFPHLVLYLFQCVWFYFGGLWPTLIWVLCRMMNVNIWIRLHSKIQFSRHHLLKVLSFFSILYFWISFAESSIQDLCLVFNLIPMFNKCALLLMTCFFFLNI